MRVIRLIFITILVLAVLPWGAYAARFGLAPAHPAIPAAAEAQIRGAKAACGIVAVVTCHAAAQDAAVVVPPRRCHGPALPGAPCGPDAVLAQKQATPAVHRSLLPRLRDKFALPIGRALRPDLGPPRIG